MAIKYDTKDIEVETIRSLETGGIRLGGYDVTYTDINFLDPVWTEEDPGTDIVVTAPKVAWTALPRNLDSYVYYDFTAAYFDGDFRHEFEIEITAQELDCMVVVWGLANTVDDFNGIDTGNGSFLALRAQGTNAGQGRLRIYECDSGSLTEDGYDTLLTDTVYYCTVVRDESIGTHGTLYCYIYSDSARTILVDKLQLALNTSKKDFRYLYSVSSWNTGGAQVMSGYTQNLRLSTDPFGIEKGIYVYDDGAIDMEMQSGCRVWGGNSVNHNTWTTLQLVNEFWDHQNEFNITTYRFTAKKGGKYIFSARTRFNTSAGAYLYRIRVQKNGAAVGHGQVTQEENNDRATPEHNDEVALDANDYIDVEVYQNTTIARGAANAHDDTWLSIHKVT